MEFTVSLGFGAWIVLILGSLIFGIAIQLIGRADFGYEWVVTAVATFIGAVVASEFIVGLRDFQPVLDGLALIPALVGGLALGLVAAIATRLVTGGSFTPHAASGAAR
jgi:uncharacterized membrane protein YeaQ/YmgE (transglycosylase-associated protein family)